MTLSDNETGNDIINPYITLYAPGENAWVSLNTATFAQAQNAMINFQDEQTYIKYAIEERKRLCKVVATIGQQDHRFDYETRNHWTRGVRSGGVSDAVALIPLGYILEDLVKDLFPKTYKFFESVKDKKKE